MPSIRLKTRADGSIYYEIRVSRGRSKSYLTKNWSPPTGWSKKAVDRELNKVAAEFEQKCKAGLVLSRHEKAEKFATEMAVAEAEAAKIVTLKSYVERIYMPALTVKCSENTRESYQRNFTNWIFPALGAIKLQEISSKEIDALLLDMQSQGKAHGTVVKVYTILSSVFKKA